MLPEAYRQSIRQLQLFTLAGQLRRIAGLKQELEDLDQIEADFSQATW